MKEFLGENFSYKNLKLFIYESDNSSEEIMKLAFLLGNPELLACKRWRNLSEQFFIHHRKDILAWCKYDNLVEKMNAVPVVEDEVLIDIFSGMKREGVFGVCSFRQLALCMLFMFDMDLNMSTLCNRLTDSDGYSFKKICYDYWHENNEKLGN